jgi:hypothetical protein
MDLDREYGMAVQTRFIYTVYLLGCNVIADNSFNIAITNGYTKLNNILGVVSLFITLQVIGLPQKINGAIGAAWVIALFNS